MTVFLLYEIYFSGENVLHSDVYDIYSDQSTAELAVIGLNTYNENPTSIEYTLVEWDVK